MAASENNYVSNTVGTFHALLVPKTKSSYKKKEGFPVGQVCLAHAYFYNWSLLLPQPAEYAYSWKNTCNYSSGRTLYVYMIAKQERIRSHIFWRLHLSLYRNQVVCKNKSNFWRVLSKGDNIECISFFVDK